MKMPGLYFRLLKWKYNIKIRKTTTKNASVVTGFKSVTNNKPSIKKKYFVFSGILFNYFSNNKCINKFIFCAII
jgi:hypothetical protein